MTQTSQQYREQSAVVRFGEGWALPSKTALGTQMTMKANQNAILDQSQPGSSMTMPTIVHQDGGVKCATDVLMSKICIRGDFVIRMWNSRTLYAPGKVQELTHEMKRYH